MSEKSQDKIKELQEKIEALNKENELYRQIINKLPIGIQLFDKEGTSYLYNEKQKELLGLPNLSTGIGKFNVLNDPYAKESGASKLYEKAYKGISHEHNYEYNLGSEDNKWDTKKEKRTFNEKIIPITNKKGEVQYVLAELEDISEKIKHEIELEDSQKRWKFAIENNKDGLWDWNMITNEVFFSTQWKKMIGYDDHELPNKFEEWDKRIHPEDREKTYTELDKHIKGKTEIYQSEHRLKCKDGSYKWILDRGMIIDHDENNKPSRMLGTHTDISYRKNAEKALQASEQKYRLFVENFTGIAFSGDFNFVPSFFHGAVEDITGYTEAEFLEGKPRWIDIIGKDYLTEIETSAKKLKTVPNYSTTREYKIFRKDGLQRWVRERIHNLTDENNNIIGVQGVIYDITINKIIENKVKENEKKFKAIFETLEIGLSITNENGDIIDCNQASEKILGLSRKEHLSKNHFDRNWNAIKPDHSPFPPREFASVKALKENRTISNIEMGIKKKGKITWISVSATPLKIKGFGVFIAYADITDIKEKEQKLRELNNAKDKILSIISHDLRTPFNALIGMNKLAEQKLNHNNIESAKRIIHSVQKSSQTTLNLLDNLLQWARAQTNRISFTPLAINLHELTQEIIDFSKLNYNSKKIEVQNTIEKDIQIVADRNMLSTIIRNLISNAIKFTGMNGKIVMGADSTDKEYTVFIKDNGVGIDTNNLQNLFKITNNFTQYGTNEEKGTGLGLMLCKDFIERHNGKIWIESKKDEGTTAYFSIPKRNV